MSVDTGKILDGRACSQELKDALKLRVAALAKRGIVPGLATVLVGDDPASKVYVANKHKDCTEVGIKSFHVNLPASTTEGNLVERVKEYNENPLVHGILVQLPLPKQVDVENILACIDPRKDVDGFHPQNLGNLLRGNGKHFFTSCTPAGIVHLLKWAKVDMKGMDAVIVNRSNIVGKPLVPLLLQENATVQVCHTGTRDLVGHCSRADLVVAGTGKARMFTPEYFKKGAIVVDVGMNRTEQGLCGDVDFSAVVDKVAKITPVPGGVGLMTRAMLLQNTVTAAES
ncbi:MAG: bifunctional 5,10-methylenetetrahydrofolate dehydrogenase/5,10-methenyltetrahydrofolate cyclohydrolase [Candidatus Lokiarchaeota archaeon]|nr:bifunctional 5,10-methylenetetrahydrofolate dehydrogenase/5,10-methenyltetrahydrofolate cyclohydrolase [Candidatus Lokiarchaeota archaeon]